MKATFQYTGNALYVSLSLEDDGDQAIARIVEQRLNNARVNVSYESGGMYSYRDPKPNGIHITLLPPTQTSPGADEESK